MAKVQPRPSSTSLEELLKRKRPAKPQKQGEEWKVDELVAAPLAGIQEFVEMAASPEPVAISLSMGNAVATKTGMPDTTMLNSAMPVSDILDRACPAPEQSAPAAQQLGIPEADISVTGMPAISFKTGDRVIPIPRLVPPPEPAKETTMPDSGMAESSMPESNLLDFGSDLQLLPVASTPVLHPISPMKVQEIFTKGEAAVYTTLWRLAAAVSKDLSRPYRDIRIGYIRLARESGMAWSNCRVNLNGLAEKLAISRVPPATPGGPTGYRVYGFSAIYRHVTDAGYTHYIRSGRGVELHKKEAGMPDMSMPDTSMPPTTTMPDTSMPAPVAGVPDTGMLESCSGMLDTGMLLNSKRIPVVKPAPPELTDTVIALVTRFFGRCDATYAGRIVRDILVVCPTATMDEVYAFIADNAPEIRQNQRIESKTGVLLSRAQASFVGEALRKLRADLPRWKEQQAFWLHRNDAYACEWEREWKRRYFDDLNAQATEENA
jgi:hypothetical protein